MDDKKPDENCSFCGLPYKNHAQCPSCGYTWCDVQMHGDHHLCGKPQPEPPTGLEDRKPEGTHSQYGPESGGHWKKPPDPIRAAAEETNSRIGVILRTAPFTDEPLETITCCIEQALRAAVERERERCINIINKVRESCEPKILYGEDVFKIIDRIRQGG